ncbi:MAG: hypothetical protein QE279_02120 [Rhodoferax sp.]|nr:hypothetical protein [Rhodoferax sp.]
MHIPTLNQSIQFIVGLIVSGLTGFHIFRKIPEFAEVFKSFGGNLPAATQLTMQWYPVALLLPALVIAAWFLYPKIHRRGTAALITAIAASAGSLLFIVFIMYLPIIALRQ